MEANKLAPMAAFFLTIIADKLAVAEGSNTLQAHCIRHQLVASFKMPADKRRLALVVTHGCGIELITRY
jgi:hypothetical protein